MSEITIANVDWSIVEAVAQALTEATADDESVFAAVAVCTDRRQARQCQFHDSPAVILRYVTTVEEPSCEDVRGGQVAIELTIAAMLDQPADDEAERLCELLRLKNAAINAVEASPPPAARAWGDSRRYRRRIEWGRPRVDTSTARPWAVCRLPVQVGFLLDGPSQH